MRLARAELGREPAQLAVDQRVEDGHARAAGDALEDRDRGRRAS